MTTTWPPNIIGFFSFNNTYAYTSCNPGSTWTSSATYGRCCPEVGGADCQFYRSCLSTNVFQYGPSTTGSCASGQQCYTATVYQTFPDVSPLSRILCIDTSPPVIWHTTAAMTSMTSDGTSSPTATPFITALTSVPTQTGAFGSATSSPTAEASSSNKGVVIGASIGGVALLLVLIALVALIWYLNRRVSTLSDERSRHDGFSAYAGSTAPAGGDMSTAASQFGGSNTAFTKGHYATYNAPYTPDGTESASVVGSPFTHFGGSPQFGGAPRSFSFSSNVVPPSELGATPINRVYELPAEHPDSNTATNTAQSTPNLQGTNRDTMDTPISGNVELASYVRIVSPQNRSPI